MADQFSSGTAHELSIGSITLDCQMLRLQVDGREIKLRPQAFEVLRILMEYRDQLVSRHYLLDEVWGTKVVTEDSLAQCLVDIRRALRDIDREIVLTVPSRGYRFQSHLVNGAGRGHGFLGQFRPNRVVPGIVAVVAVAVVGLMVATTSYINRHNFPDRNGLAGPEGSLQSGGLTKALVAQARNILLLSRGDNNAEARRLLGQALEIDPRSVSALVALADAARKSGGRAGSESFQSAWRTSIDLTERALEIDPNHPGAVAQKAWTELYYYQNYEEAARNFERAIQLDPDDPDVVRLASNAMLVLDRPDIGVRLGLESVAKNPLCVECYMYLSLTAQFSGDLELAEMAARRALTAHPDQPAALERLGDVLLARGLPELALSYFEKRTDEHAGLLLSKAVAHYRIGNQNEYNRLRAQLIAEYGATRPSSIAQLEAESGAIDEAFDWLERHLALPRRVKGFNYHSPFYENLRSDARWFEFRRRIGLSHDQLARIAFDPAVPF